MNLSRLSGVPAACCAGTALEPEFQRGRLSRNPSGRPGTGFFGPLFAVLMLYPAGPAEAVAVARQPSAALKAQAGGAEAFPPLPVAFLCRLMVLRTQVGRAGRPGTAVVGTEAGGDAAPALEVLKRASFGAAGPAGFVARLGRPPAIVLLPVAAEAWRRIVGRRTGVGEEGYRLLTCAVRSNPGIKAEDRKGAGGRRWAPGGLESRPVPAVSGRFEG